ncbi:CDP-diacylglycerol--glycerol-3-phosphate 3-phosphatidyltransferase [Paenibacillus sp. TRM 82003]|uniref:CDP-diacylglycerol--glycerol-3-phosphate 3-phosphatidyltransferase n=1 Tax=Kineococcus sp. TRM81007 TaxID=2925831 RepID=UPI001F589297|nr:CDP-diacylglycerol--glycerol-3-phosphate 3-phosphatidyltransferase [Kineococcus sp. TRM81007]MCI2240304.1 CDP-diacylglycerol--glycerol-3-phosphate 3-phosphatidyltransferase [Kineococcus sp. TRM81007]MCI3927519.1 CDP-diacylglycerol--glycerol-3-phosphate 3-phosphatidyltransferase [Paenibacillus sp. TRM 82003]
MSARTGGSGGWRTAHRAHLPNALTVLRLLLVPLFVWFLAEDGGRDWRWRLAAAAVFAAASITDRYDGHLARRWGTVSDFGKVADPLADKALIGSALVVLSLQGRVPWWMTALILAREVLVTLLRFLLIRRGTILPADRGGKVKTVVQIAAVALFVLPLPDWAHWPSWLVMLAAVVLTLTSARGYFTAGLKLLRG